MYPIDLIHLNGCLKIIKHFILLQKTSSMTGMNGMKDVNSTHDINKIKSTCICIYSYVLAVVKLGVFGVVLGLSD